MTDKQFTIKRFDFVTDAARWNDMVSQSRQGSFLFDRRYMDYHSDRFKDLSLMVLKGDRLVGLFPASVEGNTVTSHGGLTYGGLLTTRRATSADVAASLDAMNNYLASIGISEVIYKPVPHIYHTVPAEDDLYHLWRTVDIKLIGRQISSTIDRDCRPRLFEIRRRGVKRALQAGVTIECSDDYGPFWEILSRNLGDKYNTTPVHSLDEISLLAERFPENIKLFVARHEGEVIAGVVIYLTSMVAHAQYITASPVGKEIGALDALFEYVVNSSLERHRYFDFGISTEQRGSYLNASLLYQKEGFGARATLYDLYRYTL